MNKTNTRIQLILFILSSFIVVLPLTSKASVYGGNKYGQYDYEVTPSPSTAPVAGSSPATSTGTSTTRPGATANSKSKPLSQSQSSASPTPSGQPVSLLFPSPAYSATTDSALPSATPAPSAVHKGNGKLIAVSLIALIAALGLFWWALARRRRRKSQPR